MANMGVMKMSRNFQDKLLVRANRHAQSTGSPLSAVVEEGLRQGPSAVAIGQSYALPDHSVGESGEKDPMDAFPWQDLREVIYGEPERR